MRERGGGSWARISPKWQAFVNGVWPCIPSGIASTSTTSRNIGCQTANLLSGPVAELDVAAGLTHRLFADRCHFFLDFAELLHGNLAG
jgi:hypothetical protein